jgi:hypothetical protein
LLLLSLWIIYAKRTAGDKNRGKKEMTLYHIQKKRDENEKKNIYNYAQSTLSFFFRSYSIYLPCLSTTDSHFFSIFFSVSFVMFPICARRIKKRKNKRKQKKISFDHDHMMIMMMIMMVMNISTRLL